MEPSSKASSGLEFFKVFLPSSSSLRMCIPPAFVKHFNGKLPRKGILKVESGKSWHVSLEKLNSGVYFKNGWQAFAEDRFLKYGDFLIFQYDGNQTFDVKLFCKNGLKKELAVVPVSSVTSVPKVKIEHEPQVEKEDDKSLMPCKRKHLDVGSSRKSDTVLKARRISTPNPERRRSPRILQLVASRGPCFERTLKSWSKHVLYISNQVLKEHKISLKPEVVLRDEEGKTWPVTVSCTTQNRIRLNNGWSQFYEHQNLSVNDTCEFEFVVGRASVCRQINVRVTRHSLPSLLQITWQKQI